MLPTVLQDIVWAFCGDMRDLRHRLHKFVGLEIRIWGIVRGCPVRPSYLRARNNVRGPIVKLKHALELAFFPLGDGDQEVHHCVGHARIRGPVGGGVESIGFVEEDTEQGLAFLRCHLDR
mgnify:CR=1 FL=1